MASHQIGVQPKVLGRTHFPKEGQFRTGRLHIIFGILSVLVGAACFALETGGGADNLLSRICSGIWGGGLVMLTGFLGLAAANTENTCYIIATLIFSILGFGASAVFTIFSTLMCVIDRNHSRGVTAPFMDFKLFHVTFVDNDVGMAKTRLFADIMGICVGICVMFLTIIQFAMSMYTVLPGKAAKKPLSYSTESPFSGTLIDDRTPPRKPSHSL